MMRIDCKNYESRSYPSGDTVRMCRIDLAPEAPWRCPADCPGFERKMAGGGWIHGSLVNKLPDEEPPVLDNDAISLLDRAEDIVNQAGPDILSELGKQPPGKSRKKRPWWRFGRK